MGLQLKEQVDDIDQQENLLTMLARIVQHKGCGSTDHTGATADLQRLHIGKSCVLEGPMERRLLEHH
jgi:hypothetical protein